MKLGNLLAAVATTVLFFAAQNASAAGIAGTKHDFSGAGWNAGGQICSICHAPHNTNTTGQLWNHAMTAATFTLYTSNSLKATLGQPAGVSKLCLSCHDGTVALDNFGGVTTGTNIVGAGTGGNTKANLGTSLANDHPISFTYDAALVTAKGGLKATTAIGLPLYTSGTATSQMECATCHDVHTPTPGTVTGSGYFLRAANTGSALCLSCHIK